MGRDKATLRLRGGGILGQRALDALRGCADIDDDVAVIGGDRDMAEVLGGRWVADPSPPIGPVGGVLAAVQDAGGRGCDAVVVLPCDLPSVEARHVTTLITAARPWPSSVVIASVGQRAAYPIGVWPTWIADPMACAVGDRPVDFATALGDLPTRTVAMPDAFRDADEPKDLADRGLV
jgi:molybdopterin-guanine dinucleotide biosynthesis protein A